MVKMQKTTRACTAKLRKLSDLSRHLQKRFNQSGGSINAMKSQLQGLYEVRGAAKASDEIRKINGQIKRLSKNLKRMKSVPLGDVSTRLGAVGKALGSTGKGAGAYLGVSQVISFATASLRKFDEQAKSDAQLRTVLTSTNGAAGRSFEQLAKQADLLQTKTLFGDEAVQGVQAMMLNFKNVRGEMLDKSIPAVLDMATAMRMDGKSAAMQLGQVLNDPQANLLVLSQSGVQFSEQQKKQIQHFQATNQLAQAQAMILNELNSQFGGRAQTAAHTGMGTWQQFMNVVGGLQEALGGWFSQILSKVADFFTQIVDQSQPLIDAWNRIKQALAPLYPAILSFLGAMGLYTEAGNGASVTVSVLSTVMDVLATAIDIIVRGITGLLSILEPLAPVILVIAGAWAVYELVMMRVNAVMYANPVGLIIGAIVILIGVIAYVAAKTDGWGKTWKNLVQFMKLSIQAFVANFKLNWAVFKHVFLTGIETIQKGWYKVKGLWDKKGAQEGLARLQTARNERLKEIAEKRKELNGWTDKMKNQKIWEVKWNNKSFGDVTKSIKEKLGMSTPEGSGAPHSVVPGVPDGGSTTESIVTGGKRQQVFNIHINKVLEMGDQIVHEGREQADEITSMVLEGITRSVSGTIRTAAS